MHSKHWRLINGLYLEALPCVLLRGRGNTTARLLSQADWLIRRKSDGRYLAVASDNWLETLKRDPKCQRACEQFHFNQTAFSPEKNLHLLQVILNHLEIRDDYGIEHKLELIPEPDSLQFAGFDRYARPLWLQDAAAHAWLKMQREAGTENIVLEAISGYRGYAYQYSIFKRKFARGQSVHEVLKVNAAPGYSEHHSGRAIDIGTPNEPPAEESFEMTSAFAWLNNYAQDFGFRLSYPRNNLHDINYEPWHWYFIGTH